ncbi:MAG: hypothetical protein QM811_06160 [Pirellulales bacterium]
MSIPHNAYESPRQVQRAPRRSTPELVALVVTSVAIFVGIQFLPGFALPVGLDNGQDHIGLANLNLIDCLGTPYAIQRVIEEPDAARSSWVQLARATALVCFLLVVPHLLWRGTRMKYVTLPLLLGLNFCWLRLEDGAVFLSGFQAQCYLFGAFSVLGIMMTLFPLAKHRPTTDGASAATKS